VPGKQVMPRKNAHGEKHGNRKKLPPRIPRIFVKTRGIRGRRVFFRVLGAIADGYFTGLQKNDGRGSTGPGPIPSPPIAIE
jgi:hypothetical protein